MFDGKLMKTDLICCFPTVFVATDLKSIFVQGCNLQWLAVTNSVDQTAALRRFTDTDLALSDRIKVIEISKLLAGRTSVEISTLTDKNVIKILRQQNI